MKTQTRRCVATISLAGGVSADDAATLEEEEQRRVEEEIALAERLSPGLVAHAVGSPGMSPGWSRPVIDQSPERTRSKFQPPRTARRTTRTRRSITTSRSSRRT